MRCELSHFRRDGFLLGRCPEGLPPLRASPLTSTPSQLTDPPRVAYIVTYRCMHFALTSSDNQ